jgi:OOP family OmpA-OmpF porin
MNFKKSYITMGGALFVLSACAGNVDFEWVAKMPGMGTPFQNALQKEYVELSKSEYSESDIGDMIFFAKRGKMAAEAQSFGPQKISARALPANKVGALSGARARLVKALAGGGKTRAPKAAARAQAMFDCWMQEQEENFQPDDIIRCRVEFNAAMAKLKIPMMAKAAPAPKTMPAPKPAPAKLPGPFTVYFDFDSMNINAAAKKSIIDIAVAHLESKPGTILLGGHTDRAGSNGYNDSLSRMRAQSVAAALIKTGIPTSKIRVDSFGENLTQVSTSNNKRERLNRRVVVIFRR